jgi:heterodisulfide reductase subunit A2
MKRVLILGAGIAGATAAERLGRAGLEVHLVERNAEIGGHAARTGCKATDVCLRCNACVADATLRAVKASPSIQRHTGTRLLDLQSTGKPARYRATLEPGGARLDVDAVVVATGFTPFSPRENSSLAYARLPNVITGEDAERQLASAQTITRPSDSRAPGRVAFIQCVGSRTEEAFRRPEDTNYCSSVCCAYALRMARRMKHEVPQTQITVFYMDIQNFGANFDAFFGACRDQLRLVRSRPYDISAGPDGSLLVKFAPDAAGPADKSVVEEAFDLVILSVGIRPNPDAAWLAERIGVPLDKNGFFGLKQAAALPDLQRAGIYAIGAAEGPKDIAGSMAQAEAVAAAIMADLAPRMLPRRLRPERTGVAAAVPVHKQKVSQDVVVVGSGVSALQATATLANLKHSVTLVSNQPQLGGQAAAAPEWQGYLADDPETAVAAVKTAVTDLVRQVSSDGLVSVVLDAHLAAVEGELGNFTVTVRTNGANRHLHAGAVILATGFPGRPSPAPHSSVIGMADLLPLIRSGKPPKRIALLMDLGAEQNRDVTAAVFSAAERLLSSGSSVKVFCGNARVAATGMESLYRRARRAGAGVIKSASPAVKQGQGSTVAVAYRDPVAGMEIAEEFDLVVAADVKPDPEAVARIQGNVPGFRTGPAGALQYDSVWLLPGCTNRPGLFVAGSARGNSVLREALTDGLAVAAEVHDLLGARQVLVADDAAVVDPDKCVLCLTCVRICPHGAISIDRERKAAAVSSVACRRCGICAAECPAVAIQLPAFTDEDLAAALGARPSVTVLACENSALPAADAAAARASVGGAKVQLVRVPCAGKVDPRTVLQALERGAEKVLILGCHPESCRYLTGATRASSRAKRLIAALEKAGVDPKRVQFGGLASVEPARLAKYMTTVQTQPGA